MCIQAILDIDPVHKTMTMAAGEVLPLSRLDLIVVRCPNESVLEQLSDELDRRELPVWCKRFVFAGVTASGSDSEHCALLACPVEHAERFGRMLLPLCERLGAELEASAPAHIG